MPSLAVARLYNVEMGNGIIEYLRHIDATLAPNGGRYIIHGGPYARLEGNWSGDLVVIAFPTYEAARAWYESPRYQRILPSRQKHSTSDVILIDGVLDGHRATDVLASGPRLNP
jgi:uncharacterized protein (DUF1330 family)